MSLLDTLRKEKLKLLQKDTLTLDDEKLLDLIELKLDNEKDNPELFFEDKAFVPKKLGDVLMAKAIFKTIIGSDDIYYYKDGLYIPNGKELIKGYCVDMLQDKFKTNYMNEVINYIQASTYVDPNQINDGWINLENGLLNPLNMEFKSHTPEVFSITRIPIIYDTTAECPLWLETLNEKTSDHTFLTVQEMFGYCFMPGQKHEKGFLLYGPKRTFKSTTLCVLEELIGKDNLTAFSLQQLNNDNFAAAYLYGKQANICADITSKSLYDTGRFLTITGGDAITAGKKGGHHVTFYPSSKLLFSCNVIPATTNKNPAFYRRWIILEFNIQTPVEKVDPNFKERLKEELPGILNWALEGLKRLEEQCRFSYQLSEDEVKDLYERSSDTIQSFVYKEIDMDDDLGALTKRETFQQYLKYCKSNKLQPENVIKFGRMFIALTGCSTGKKGTGEASLPAYKGVNFKSIDEVKKKESIDYYTSDDNNV